MKSNKSRKGRNGLSDHVISVPFKLLASTTGATSYALTLIPSSALFPRCATIADAFELYRIKKLRFRLIPGATGGTVVAGYLPGVVDTPPATIALVGEILHSVILGTTQTVPSRWCDVPAVSLKSYETWYKTIAGTPDTAQENQGTIFIAASAAGTAFLIEAEAIYEFKGAVDPTNTPAMRLKAEWAREKERILRALAPSPPVTTPSADLSVRVLTPG